MADDPLRPPDDDWYARFGMWVCVGFAVLLIAVMVGMTLN